MVTGRKIIVAGAAGYVGIHLCDHLKRMGHEVIGIDDFSTGSRFFKRYVDIQHDLKLPFEQTDHLLGVDTIINLAAFAYVGESVKDPLRYWENNLGIQINLLKLARALDIKTFILASSCAVYGTPKDLPIKEDCDLKPVNPYGSTKLACEDLQIQFSKIEGFNSLIFRFFNVVGGNTDEGLGEIHDPETHLLPLIIKAAFDENFNLQVYGDDYETPDGSAIRDYLDVRDLCLAIGKSLNMEKADGIFNLGTESPLSVFDLIKLVEKTACKKVKYFVASRRLGDPARLYSNCETAHKSLNWNSAFSIEDSIESAIAWYLKRLKTA